jgi:nucleoside-diphosphate-sugar epimerase
MITRYATWLMARDLSYSTAKARAELGWCPLETYAQTINRTVAWYLDQQNQQVQPGRR